VHLKLVEEGESSLYFREWWYPYAFFYHFTMHNNFM